MSDLILRIFRLPLRDSVSIRPANGLYPIAGFGDMSLCVATNVAVGSAASFSRLKNRGQRFIAMYYYFPNYTTSRPISP
jgi:hypothetical protein